MNTFHILWIIGVDDQGRILSTGKDYTSNLIEDAIAEWRTEHPDIKNPIYALQK